MVNICKDHFMAESDRIDIGKFKRKALLFDKSMLSKIGEGYDVISEIKVLSVDQSESYKDDSTTNTVTITSISSPETEQPNFTLNDNTPKKYESDFTIEERQDRGKDHGNHIQTNINIEKTRDSICFDAVIVGEENDIKSGGNDEVKRGVYPSTASNSVAQLTEEQSLPEVGFNETTKKVISNICLEDNHDKIQNKDDSDKFRPPIAPSDSSDSSDSSVPRLALKLRQTAVVFTNEDLAPENES